MEEVWKLIINYEGLYEVSNLGRVKSLKRQGTNNRIIKQFDNTRGYMIVSLTKHNVQKSFKVHRLVAQAFIPNQDNYPEVNHIDGNKTNNIVSNLEWCSRCMNQQHCI